jgi:hypothetical protein
LKSIPVYRLSTICQIVYPQNIYDYNYNRTHSSNSEGGLFVYCDEGLARAKVYLG